MQKILSSPIWRSQLREQFLSLNLIQSYGLAGLTLCLRLGMLALALALSKCSSQLRQLKPSLNLIQSYGLAGLTLALALSSTRVTAQLPPPGPVFEPTIIPRIDILIAEQDLATLFEPGNEFSDDEHQVTFIFSNGITTDTLEEVGFRFRGNTSRTAAKKSYKISFDTYVPDRAFHGLKKLNINGEHNDPTVSRARVCWNLMDNSGIIGSRANHVELYVNNDYYGLYANIEHIEEEFVDLRYGNNSGNLYKCLWPADLNYESSNPNSYKQEFGGRRAYDLKTNTGADNYIDLSLFIDILNNATTAEFICEIEKVFNVTDYLKAMAFEILVAHWDNYVANKNNFYLYRNPATGLFEYIPFDLDNTLGVNFFSDYDFSQQDIYNWDASASEDRPLYSRMMDIPEYRDLFSYYVYELINGPLSDAAVSPLLDVIESQVESYIPNDPFHPLDYDFDVDDFHNSFDEGIGYWFIPDGIRSHLEARRASALQQLELNDIVPVISQIQQQASGINDSIFISAKVFDDQEVMAVQLHYRIGSNPTVITQDMYDDGQHRDGLAGDGIFGIGTAPIGSNSNFYYTIQAADDSGQVNTRPVCGERTIPFEEHPLKLRINEFMADNNTTITDDAGEYEDWIEIHNYGNSSISLAGKYLSDNPELPAKWPFPFISIAPGQFLLFWADNDQEQGERHSNFKLAKDGEHIGIYDSAINYYVPIDGITYGPQETDVTFGRIPNGTGPWQIMDTPTPGASNEPVSITELTNQLFAISPNPVGRQLQLQIQDSLNLIFIWELIDLTGRLVQQGTLAEGETNIAIADLPSGVYTFKLRSVAGKLIGIEKVVLEN
jgi:CotH kinase protein/Lamin Tail Domain/Secretion system C-terminal sorting domain